mmetsp:Transcript_93356/g.278737  ORF Transcript_93356/g.278737 Transcript_93356/m.278737 type:complete len:201 (+) Transcript_93356:39-641(+)
MEASGCARSALVRDAPADSGQGANRAAANAKQPHNSLLPDDFSLSRCLANTFSRTLRSPAVSKSSFSTAAAFFSRMLASSFSISAGSLDSSSFLESLALPSPSVLFFESFAFVDSLGFLVFLSLSHSFWTFVSFSTTSFLVKAGASLRGSSSCWAFFLLHHSSNSVIFFRAASVLFGFTQDMFFSTCAWIFFMSARASLT